MKTIPFASINSCDLQFSQILALAQRWDNHAKYSYLTTMRPNHGITLILCKKAVYTVPGGEIYSAQYGDILYLPKSARYEVEFITEQTMCSSLLINFTASDAGKEEIRFSDDISIVLSDTGRNFYDLFYDSADIFKNSASDHLVLKANLYTLFSKICRKTDNISPEYQLIQKGIQYIEEHSMTEKPISDIAKMCCVSETCFRKLFQKYTGKSPIAYKTDIKLSKAKQLLCGSELSVEEVSDTLGFYDKAYFSKVFRQKIGLSPSAYRKQTLQAKRELHG